MDISELDQSSLDGEDLPRLIFIPVEDAYNLLWERNPKLHNIGELIQSFIEHGFQELPKYDATLGAIKAGNGRIEAMYLMAKDAAYKDKRPRGIAQTKDGRWAIPLLVGTDAKSIDLAIAYAIDSNNLTMSGGDFTGLDMSRMWDQQEYIDLLQSIFDNNILPISVDESTIEILSKIINFSPPNLSDLANQYGEPNEQDFWPVIRLQVSPIVKGKFDSLLAQYPGNDSEKLDALISGIEL